MPAIKKVGNHCTKACNTKWLSRSHQVQNFLKSCGCTLDSLALSETNSNKVIRFIALNRNSNKGFCYSFCFFHSLLRIRRICNKMLAKQLVRGVVLCELDRQPQKQWITSIAIKHYRKASIWQRSMASIVSTIAVQADSAAFLIRWSPQSWPPLSTILTSHHKIACLLCFDKSEVKSR